jgi:hypothetical protein
MIACIKNAGKKSRSPTTAKHTCREGRYFAPHVALAAIVLETNALILETIAQIVGRYASQKMAAAAVPPEVSTLIRVDNGSINAVTAKSKNSPKIRGAVCVLKSSIAYGIGAVASGFIVSLSTAAREETVWSGCDLWGLKLGRR